LGEGAAGGRGGAAMVVRIGVVGAGPLVGIHHCNAIRALGGDEVELACICQKRKEDVALADRLGVKVYTDPFEMAKSEHLDGVVIATPNDSHLPVTKACIEGAEERKKQLGVPTGIRAMLVEKPICEDLSSATALIRTAEKHGIEVLVGHQRRHSAFVKKARDFVVADNFGPLRGFSGEFALLKPQGYFESDDPKLAWRTKNGSGGPVLINLIHDVDLMRFITGHEISQVYAVTMRAARGYDVEDTGVVTLTMDHGAVGSLFFSDAVPSPWSYEFTTLENKKYPPVPGEGAKDCYHFMGAQQSLAFPSLRRYSYGKKVAQPGWDSPMSVVQTDVDKVDPIQVQMEHFVRVCRGEEKPLCSGMDAIESLAVIAAVRRSAESGLPVRPGDMLAEASGQSVIYKQPLAIERTARVKSEDMSTIFPGATPTDSGVKHSRASQCSASKGNVKQSCASLSLLSCAEKDDEGDAVP